VLQAEAQLYFSLQHGHCSFQQPETAEFALRAKFRDFFFNVKSGGNCINRYFNPLARELFFF